MEILEFGIGQSKYIRPTEEQKGKRTRKFRDDLCLDPSPRKEMRLRDRARRLGGQTVAVELAEFYRARIARIEERRARLLDGFGQCEGYLITDGRNILVACCPQMAEQVRAGGAHMHKGSLFLNDRLDEHSVAPDGTVSIIRGDKPCRIDFCPFCM